MNEKTNDLKVKLTLNLNEMKQLSQPEIVQHNSSSDNLVFEMCLQNESSEQRKFVWLCEKQQDREDFLNTLWKLSEEFLKASDRPKFVNFQFESKYYFKILKTSSS